MIVSIGEAGLDYYTATGDVRVGGIATNFAVHVQRLRHPVTLITAVGNDQNGQMVLRQITAEGLQTEHVQILDGSTASQDIRLMGKERFFCGFAPGVLTGFALTDHDIALMDTADAVVAPLTDGLKDVFDAVMKRTYEKPLKVADFSRDADIPGFAHGDVVAMLMHYLEHIDAAFIGGDETLQDVIASIAESNPEKMITLTLGPKGVQTFFRDRVYTQPAKWVREMVDTTGCGDAFRAGFLTEYLGSKNIQKALEAGSVLAAATATHVGGF